MNTELSVISIAVKIDIMLCIIPDLFLALLQRVTPSEFREDI